jgi:yecA family protein
MTFDSGIEPLKKALQYLEVEASPYELHGILSGLLCGNADISAREWISMSSGEMNLSESDLCHLEKGDKLAEEAVEVLTHLYTETVSAFSSNALDYYPLLPENEENIIQLQGIAAWAQGFLLGLGLAGIENFADYPSEVAEFVTDLSSISQADDYELAGDESDEETIMQLIEFIRVGVLLVNEEMNPLRLPIEIPADEAFGFLPAEGSLPDEGSFIKNS